MSAPSKAKPPNNRPKETSSNDQTRGAPKLNGGNVDHAADRVFGSISL